MYLACFCSIKSMLVCHSNGLGILQKFYCLFLFFYLQLIINLTNLFKLVFLKMFLFVYFLVYIKIFYKMLFNYLLYYDFTRNCNKLFFPDIKRSILINYYCSNSNKKLL